MVKKVFFSLAVFSLMFLAAAAIKVKAGNNENVSGWLWGGNSGVNVSDTSLGWISANNLSGGGTKINYGMNIPDGDGNVSGYAWSENLGWIDFDPAGPYPTAPNKSAARSGDNLEGWARIVSIAAADTNGNSGGWKGWVKMSGTNYGVVIDEETGELSNYAWSDELGWIDFSRASIGPVTPPAAKTLKICDGSCNGGIMIADTSNISSLTMLETDPIKNLVACYNSDAGCGIPTTDDTSTTVWADDNNPNDAVSLIGANPASSISLSPNDAIDINKERVSAVYNGETAAFDVTVIAVCSCKNCDVNNKCVPETFTGANCPCTSSCAVDSNCVSPSPSSTGPNWREVAP